MVLDKYISDLLYRYDCVIVPGFGGFITNKVSAKNLSTQHKFFPPTKEIAFNKNLNNNDGLLANYLMQAKKISYTHAIELIKTSVHDWNILLEEDGTFEIKKVGSFKLNEARTLIFSPEENINYLTESYGLSHFTSLTIKRAGEKAKVKPLNSNSENKQTSSISKIVKYAAIIVPFIAIGALSFYQINIDKDTVSNANIGINPEVIIKEISPVEVKEVKNQTKQIDTKKEVAKPIVTPSKILKYHVISGAFSNKQNAEKNIVKLEQKGIEANLIGQNKKGFFMVAYKSFDNVEDASLYMKNIKANINNSAWIWKKALK
jgi:hypothetical protein